MPTQFDKYLDYYRYNPWDECDGILSLSGSPELPDSCRFPENGIPQRNPDTLFEYRFDLMLESESKLRSFLGHLVDFRQQRKLTQFLLGFCDAVEITFYKDSGALKECRFQIDFSDRISIIYSTRMCGCITVLDGKMDSFHRISVYAIDDLRQPIGKIWEQIRDLPLWETVSENGNTVRIRRKLSVF